MHRLTELPFPPYTYVPGKAPHPVREPEGHSFGQPEPLVEMFDPEHWDACQTYLFGIDLFNAGFYWEAHEQWEAVWHALGRRGHTADFLKGLIKLAAAGVKQLEGRPEGVRRHARRAQELFTSVAAELTEHCGFGLGYLQEVASDVARQNDGPISFSQLEPRLD